MSSDSLSVSVPAAHLDEVVVLLGELDTIEEVLEADVVVDWLVLAVVDGVLLDGSMQ